MGNAYYGRRPSMRSMPSTTCGQRTATYGMYSEPVVSPQECDDMVLAMAYIPVQSFGDLYDVDEGFHQGTIFADLDKPFMGGGCNCGM